VAAELNPERRAYYERCCNLGGAQSDIANLTAEDIDWENEIVSFRRKKTGTPSIIRFGAELERVLKACPRFVPHFPEHRTKHETQSAKEFWRARAIRLLPPARPRSDCRAPASSRCGGNAWSLCATSLALQAGPFRR
jgi:hypothetical protein